VIDPRHESGIPPARTRHPAERTLIDEGDEHVQLALAESTRTEANLGSLLRGLTHLAAGASAARDANLALFHELEKVRMLLGRSNAEERVLRQRLRVLEQSLECEKQDSVRARASFIEQEDSFLAELLEDHAREVGELRARLGEALSNVPSTDDSMVPVSSPPSTLGSMKLRTIRIPLPAASDGPEDDASRERRATEREPGDVGSRDRESHERLAPPRPASRPPLRQKADISTRPLVEYSLGKSEVREERIERVQPVDSTPDTRVTRVTR
jgi:hypothetical protein